MRGSDQCAVAAERNDQIGFRKSFVRHRSEPNCFCRLTVREHLDKVRPHPVHRRFRRRNGVGTVDIHQEVDAHERIVAKAVV